MNELQLQELLSVYRHRQPMPALTRRSNATWWLAAAATMVLIFAGAYWATSWRDGWRVLRDGETIASATRIERNGIGYIDVAANTVLRLDAGNRLSLQRGTIHAKTVSPPGIFIVDTPRVRAVDLGCEYILTIAADGGGILIVAAGWVGLNNRSQSLVPQGARATIDRSGALGPPVFDDALPRFKAAIARHDIAAALPFARRRDALTLINLFKTATAEERTLVYSRLNQLVPAPAGVTPGWVEPWWPAVIKASGVSAIKKKKYPRAGNAEDKTYVPSW
jgi:hypothetical protein